MKTRLTILKLLTLLCGIFATTLTFGQQFYIWTGSVNGTNTQTAGNWTTNGTTPATTLPNGNDGGVGDVAEFNGSTGNLLLTYGLAGYLNTGFGTFGITYYMSPSQNHNVQIVSPNTPQSAALGVMAVDNESSSGATLTLGDFSANAWQYAMRAAAVSHPYVNNSSGMCTINPSVEIIQGGGNTFTWDFSGTGNWTANNDLAQNNGGPANVYQQDGPGNMFWSAGSALGQGAGVPVVNGAFSAININGGILFLKSSLPDNNEINNATVANGTTLDFDPVPSANTALTNQTLNNVISGVGQLIVNNGVLTLGGANTYSGTTTLSNGVVVVNRGEIVGTSGPLGIGTANSILLNGGTLRYSGNNTFDYSSRFNTAGGQSYNIDTANQNVTFATGLGSSGGTLSKVGGGILTLTGTSSYSGLTTVNGGEVTFQGSKTSTGNITVADGATLGLYDTGTPVSVTPGTLALGSSTGCSLEFDNVHNTVSAPLNAANLSSAGTITINVLNSSFNTIGAQYPLLAWTSGSAPGVSLGILSGASGHVITNANTITLVIDATPYIWTGTGAVNNSWDTGGVNLNWAQSSVPKAFANGVLALFDDSASGNTAVTINSSVSPANVTLNNSSLTYSIASSGANNITGATGLTQSGGATNTLSGGANTYTGATTLGGGILSVSTLANGGSASDIGQSPNSAANLVLNGGALLYTGSSANIDRLFTVGGKGGVIDSSSGGSLNLTNVGSIVATGGPRSLTLRGSTVGNNLYSIITDGAGGSTTLTKNGTGSWVLTGNNTYSGGTTIANGTLQVGSGAMTGTLGTGSIVNSGSMDFNSTGTITITPAISGGGSVTNDGTGTTILAGNNSYGGNTIINAGTLQIGNGGATGTLSAGNIVTNNSTFAFNSTGSFQFAGSINGTGNLIVSGSGGKFVIAGGTAPLNTGWTLVNSGAQYWLSFGNVTGGPLTSVITNNGTLVTDNQNSLGITVTNNIVGTGNFVMTGHNGNEGSTMFLGTNTYTGGTFIYGNQLILGNNSLVGGGAIAGNIVVSNDFPDATTGPFKPGTVVFYRPDSFTFPGNITGNGYLVQGGSGVVTLTGNSTYTGSTTVSNGVLQIGNGGTSPTSIGTNTCFIGSGTLVFDLSIGGVTIPVNIVDGATPGTAGNIVQYGSGIVTLTGAITNSGSITVSNGTLAVTTGAAIGAGASSSLNVNGGDFIGGDILGADVDTNTISGNMNITAGTVTAYLNKSLYQSNTVYIANGAVTASAGTKLRVVNVGPTLVNGETYVIFPATVSAISGAANLALVTPGFSANNNGDGSITITGVQPAGSEKLTATVSGGSVHLSWPAAWTGIHLQMQTDTLSTGLNKNAWVDVPGSDASNTFTSPLIKSGAVFFRLAP